MWAEMTLRMDQLQWQVSWPETPEGVRPSRHSLRQWEGLTLQVSDELLAGGDVIYQNCLQERQGLSQTAHLSSSAFRVCGGGEWHAASSCPASHRVPHSAPPHCPSTVKDPLGRLLSSHPWRSNQITASIPAPRHPSLPGVVSSLPGPQTHTAVNACHRPQ